MAQLHKIVIVSRPSEWGNPYKLGEYCSRCGRLHSEPGSTIPCFTSYLDALIAENPDYLVPLMGKVLICKGCAHRAPTCHARVYERYLAKER